MHTNKTRTRALTHLHSTITRSFHPRALLFPPPLAHLQGTHACARMLSSALHPPPCAQALPGSEAWGCLAPPVGAAHASCTVPSRCSSDEARGPSSSSSLGTAHHMRASGSSRNSSSDVRSNADTRSGGWEGARAGSGSSSESLFGCGGLMGRLGAEVLVGVDAAAAAADARLGRSSSGAIAARGGGRTGEGEEPAPPYLGRVVYANPAFEAQVRSAPTCTHSVLQGSALCVGGQNRKGRQVEWRSLRARASGGLPSCQLLPASGHNHAQTALPSVQIAFSQHYCLCSAPAGQLPPASCLPSASCPAGSRSRAQLAKRGAGLVPCVSTQVGLPLADLQASGAGLGVLLGPASDYQDVHTLAEALRNNRCEV